MRIFPDANVLVVNYMWDGVCAKIVDAIFLEQKHDLIVGVHYRTVLGKGSS